ncbi:hypothetical protein EVAR_86346_1 [Eumeta japonica]|uniref:Uncharacterized protein n=1 Tax=Eumeta variegata TaxID=151549 RepID=A0A4C1X758_EUMVA|nr:hypothetical protein EVAR_86346_1 [Eumeta japonica]
MNFGESGSLMEDCNRGQQASSVTRSNRCSSMRRLPTGERKINLGTGLWTTEIVKIKFFFDRRGRLENTHEATDKESPADISMFINIYSVSSKTLTSGCVGSLR